MARKARAAAQDKNLRSASTSMPGPKQPSRSAASGCPASVYRPIAAPSRLPVLDSAAATHRACGNAPSRDWLEGRPKNAAFLSLSGTSVTDPSMETTRSPQQNTPGAPSTTSSRKRSLAVTGPGRIFRLGLTVNVGHNLASR